ncbi:MAG: type II toxin-antitoxin system RelE/ParE family toxin [Chloroflexi bacterium]|nr:type II toxin-antitoxin system RelE/ParE family toxin [Chloroflexota bacterium]
MVKPYAVEFGPEARESLRHFGKSDSQRILNKIKWLCENLDDVSQESLSGEFRGLFKLRVGDYRVAYTLSHEMRLITIHLIDHRRSVYKRR